MWILEAVVYINARTRVQIVKKSDLIRRGEQRIEIAREFQ